MKKANQFFYGWRIVIAVAIMIFTLSVGWTLFGIVLKQLMEQFDTGRGTVSLAQSINTIAGGVAGIFAGRLLSHYRPRMFMLWGSVACAVTALLISLSPGLWYFYVFSCIAGIATGFNGVITYFTLLSRWFTRKWGAAVGFAQAGGFIGAMAIAPVLGLIAENLGWRATYLFSGLLFVVVNLPLILFVTKDRAQSVGLLPDGDNDSTTAEQTPVVKNTGLLTFLKSPALWLLCICFAFQGIGYGVIINHEVSFLTDMKVSATVAASAVGFTIGLTAIASLASGWLADRFSSRYVAILFILLAIIGLLVLLRADTMPQIWLFVVLFGLGIGASGTLLAIVTREIFGAANFSALFGFTNVIFMAGCAIGAPLAGFIFDATGSYKMVFVIVAAFFAGAMLTIYFAFGAAPKPLVRLPAGKS
jgi:MFS family permease